jgi:hypothetical protein
MIGDPFGGEEGRCGGELGKEKLERSKKWASASTARMSGESATKGEGRRLEGDEDWTRSDTVPDRKVEVRGGGEARGDCGSVDVV